VAVDNTIAFSNGKGGVLKSTASAHLAAYAAAAGWDVLAIDTDAQANQSRDLGYVPDGGEALADALVGKSPLRPLRHPRWETLSYVAGGSALDRAISSLGNDLSRGKVGAVRAFERALAPVAGDFHLIVIDTPPRELLLRKLLFTACRFVIIPCQCDDGSIDGISGVFETAAEVRADGLNPDLEILGVFLGPIQTGATKTVRAAREQIDTLAGQEGFVLNSTVRSAQSIATYCRANGILSNEYELEALVAKTKGKRWWALSKEERAAQHNYSEAGPGLASDWQHLVDEIMTRFRARLPQVKSDA
jgi:cellulose biosynthesis protein BcsQ